MYAAKLCPGPPHVLAKEADLDAREPRLLLDEVLRDGAVQLGDRRK